MTAASPVVCMAGFDFSSAAQITGLGRWVFTTSSAGTLTVTTGRFSGQCARCNYSGANATAFLQRSADFTAVSAFSAGMAFRWGGASPFVSAPEIMRLVTSAAGRVAAIRLNTDRTLSILNAAGTAVATTASTLTQDVWYGLELVASISTSTTITLYINGTSAATAAAANLGSTNAANIMVGLVTTSGTTSSRVDIDDLWVASAATQLGDLRIETIAPTVAGNSAQWTPLSSTNVSNVDDSTSHDTDTTYNSSSTPGQIDTFAFGDLSASAATVIAIQTNVVARKDDAGTRTIADVVRQGGSDNAGTTSAGLSATYQAYEQIRNQDPSAADWTVSNVNADEYGYKEVA